MIPSAAADDQVLEVHAGPLLDPVTSTTAATWALLTGLGLLMVGNGLQGTLVGVRTQSEGFSSPATAAVITAYFAGYLAGSALVTRALASVGHIRVFAALASVASAAVIVLPLGVSPGLWIAMRLVTGLCMAGLYVVVESWLNDLATNRTRARLLAIYMVVSMGGLAAGQALLGLAGADSFDLFVVASVLVSLALVPVTLSATSTPPTTAPGSMVRRELIRTAPGGALVSLSAGASHGVLVGVGAVYAASVGLSGPAIALFLAAPMLGGVLFQFPVGLLADRLPRRTVLVAVASMGALAAVALVGAEPGTGPATVLVFLLGGSVYPLYSVGLAYTNDRLTPDQILPASSALVSINGIGAVAGPVLASGLTGLVGPTGLFWSLAAANGAVALMLALRLTARGRAPTGEPLPFVPFPPRASAEAALLLADSDRLNGPGGPGDGGTGAGTGSHRADAAPTPGP